MTEFSFLGELFVYFLMDLLTGVSVQILSREIYSVFTPRRTKMHLRCIWFSDISLVWEVGIVWHGLLKSEDIKRLQKQETCFVLFNDVCFPKNKI